MNGYRSGGSDERPGTEDELTVYTTCPASVDVGDDYLARLVDVVRWSDRAGCRGFLVYNDNQNVDAWLAAQVAMLNTEHSVPLVAVQPNAMHPHTAAKMVITLGRLHGRPVHLNMVSGGYAQHLRVLDDHVPHDDRYVRLTEYASIVHGLLTQERVSFSGKYFRVDEAYFTHRLPPSLLPRWYVSGSSTAAAGAANALRVPRLMYPQPVENGFESGPDSACAPGIRIGVIARASGSEAWRVARARFPESDVGQLMHELVAETSDSHWHRGLVRSEERYAGEQSPYWLHPFRTYGTFCPYVVGSYEVVGDYLARYLTAGVRTVVLDVPVDEDDLHHTQVALTTAQKLAATPR